MKKIIFAIALLSLVPHSQAREAFVINNLAETLSRIDLVSGEVQNHIVTLGEAPNQAALYGGFLYVVNSISADIQKIHPASFQIVHTLYLPIGSNPYNFDFSGNHVYVTGFISGFVYKLNLANYQIEDSAAVSGFPEGIRISGNYLYVTQTNFNPANFSYGQGRIIKIDPGTMNILDSIDVGTNPQWISISPDHEFFVVCTGNYADIAGSIYIYDENQNIVVDSVNIGGSPANLAISSDGIGYIAAGGWADFGHIYSFDINTREIIRGPANPILVGLGATAVAIDSSGLIYSCNFGADNVTRFNDNGQITASYNVGDGASSMVIIDQSQTGLEDSETNLEIEYQILLNSYPNPFNSQTLITFVSNAPEVNPVSLNIYNINGSLIYTFPISEEDFAGQLVWNGIDETGEQCASGPYFIVFRARGIDGKHIDLSRTILLLR